MGLLGLVLDLGKLVKEVDRGVIPWDVGAEKMMSIAAEWDEKEAIFVSFAGC